MRPLLISKVWVQAAILVFLFGFFALGLLALRTYQEQPPIPEKVVGPDGAVVFTGGDVIAGQQVFLKNGLMEYGSIFGHGAYLGPDYTADYLRGAATHVRDAYGGAESDRARQKTVEIFKRNRYDAPTKTLTFDPAQVSAFHEMNSRYQRFFSEPTTRFGLRPKAISDPEEICTDSDDGRTLMRPLDRWPHSEMARFQRALSLSLMILAAALCAVELARQGDGRLQVAFGLGAILSALLAHREWRRVRAVRTALFGG